MSAPLPRIFGIISFSSSGQYPTDLNVEISNSHSPGAWLGYSVVNGGFFEIFPVQEIMDGTTLTFSIYKGKDLIHEENIVLPVSGYLNIQISEGEFDNNIPDDSRTVSSINYAIVKGKVTLGLEYIAGSPLIVDTIKVLAKKSLFREAEIIGTCSIDFLGNYELKIPYRLLYPAMSSSPPALNTGIAKIYLDVLGTEESLATTAEFALDTNIISVDIHVSDSGNFTDFNDQYSFYSGKLADFTGLDEENFKTITFDGERPESLTLAYSTGLDEKEILNIIYASALLSDAGVNMNDGYALIRNNGQSMEVLTGLSPEKIEADLNAAVGNKIIGAIEDLAGTVTALAEKRTELIGNNKTEDGFTIEGLLGAILPEAGDVKTFIGMNMAHSDMEVEAFWDLVETTFDATKRLRLQQGLQALAITGMQPEMTGAILDSIDGGSLAEFVAAKDEPEWYSYIDGICTFYDRLCIPISIRGNVTDIHNTVVKHAYAAHLYDLSTNTFATTVAKQRVISDGDFADCFEDPEGIVAFFEENPSYDLRIDNAWQADVDGDPVLRKNLLALQNLTRLMEGKPDAVIAMMKDGIRSSSQVASMSASEFSTKYGTEIKDATLTDKLYRKATHIDMVIKQAYAQMMPGNYVDHITKDFNKDVWVDPGTVSPPYISTSPDWETLFGSLDFCACAECTSMYSPAAYFTDILNFLMTRQGNAIAYNELKRRRPDLIHIDLSCKNSNTPLPYIDLVNELLELIVLRYIKAEILGSTFFVPLSFQTSGLAKDLAAYPEHTYKGVGGIYHSYGDYTKVYELVLSKAIYPNTLPFNLALEESRVYFSHLGYSRYGLMDLYKPTDYTTITDINLISEYNLYAEWLGLSRMEADIITRTLSPAVHEWEYYGYDNEVTSLVYWYNALCNDLVLLLKRCNITYKELLQLLVTDYLNKEAGTPLHRPFVIVSKAGKPVDSCQIEDLMLEYRSTVSPPDDGILAKKKLFRRLHRFLRLQRASGWTIYQLDIILNSLDAIDGDDDITVNVFNSVATAHQWCNRLGVSPEKVCVLWNTISVKHYINFDSDTQDDFPSLYDLFFKNKAVLNPPDPNFEDPDAIVGDVQTNTGSILAAFNITDADLSLATGYTPTTAVDIELLSDIYGSGMVYTGSGLGSLQTFYDTIGLWGLELPSGTIEDRIAGWRQIFGVMDRAKESPFSLPEMTYLLEHKDAGNIYLPTDVTIQPFYENLRLLLRNISQQGSSPYIDDLLKHTVCLQFAANFNIELEIIFYLLHDIINIGSSSDKLVDYLTSLDFIDSTDPVTLINFEDIYECYYKIDKIAAIVKRLNLSNEELETFQEKNDDLDVIDLEEIPIEEVDGDFDLTDRFFYLLKWVQVRDVLRLNKPEFILLLLYSIGEDPTGTTVTKTSWVALTCQLTGWLNDDLSFLVGPDNSGNGILETHFNASTPSSNDFKNGNLLLQLFSIIKSSDRMGLRPKIVFEALKTDIIVQESQTIRKAAKAKYSEDDWLAIAKPLQDKLRIGQRDALVAYVLAHPDIIEGNNMLWKNENELFAYLLIDIEMQPCMKTSRIKQGLCTLQLFIDRIILNIERVNGSATAITMSAELMAQWQTWRKWYRVWEANRKVFLYPENWLVPELRDNKTVLFKAMETQLLQNDFTGANVEIAYRGYLEGLDEVSRLEAVCSYHEVGNGNDILHVVGRTDMNPQRYYYRRFEDNEWTSWGQIDVGVKGDQIALSMWNDRLYIFWLTFQPMTLTDKEEIEAKKAEKLTGREDWVGVVSGSQYPSYHNKWNIMLNWSSYLNDKWVKLDLSKDTMAIDTSKIQINNNATQSYSNTAYSQSILQILTKNEEITTNDFFKNRLYLYTPYESGVQADGITFSLIFPAGLDEKGDGLHSFVWKGDNSRDPYVLRGVDRSTQVIAPLGTRFNKMKFEEDPTQDGRLRKDSYTPVIDGYYSYSLGKYVSNVTRDKRATSSAVILNSTPFPSFRVTARSENQGVKGLNPMDDNFFFDDEKHTYFVRTEALNELASNTSYTGIVNKVGVSVSKAMKFVVDNYTVDYQAMPSNDLNTAYQAPIAYSMPGEQLHFYTFYHPQSPQFVSALNRGGISELLTLANQSQADSINFASNYQPSSLVNTSYPQSNVQFGFSDAYSIYNWELFFHAPMLIAEGLMNNLQFEDAQKWIHYVFNPTSNTDINGALLGTNQRFWKFYPFYELSATPIQTLSQLLDDISHNVQAAVQQVRKWENNPFQPHVIARMRILAYMKYVVMKYLDNLIAWGDQLFKRNTIESINEATQLYILAANILGDRPVKIPPRVKKDVYTFAELIELGPLDALSNALVAIESFYAPNAAPGSGYQTSNPKGGREGMNLQTLYFCLPPNDKLLAYWDIIADRLFKIRNCMNIDGVAQQLPLYDPPIDPALLVRATAMGVNINTILDEISGVGVPLYRFTYMVQKSNEIISDVKALGNALLSAIEKKDAETLSLLRSGQEIQLLDKITFIKQKQISDAQATLASLQRSRENAQIRSSYYTSRQFKNANEEEHLSRLGSAMDYTFAQGVIEVAGAIAGAFPTIHAQFLAFGTSVGGLQAANVFQAISAGIGIKIGRDNIKGNMAVTTGGYERRRDDWGLQANLAAKDIQQIDQQILGAQIRIDIANRELSNHLLQIENAEALDLFMRNKFSNVELYNWMISQISTTYFQSYQLAYDMAKRTEWCYTYELPLAMHPATGFVKFGYWDSLRKGLLAGDKLQFDVRKMESTYIEENFREYELTKNVSLAIFEPVALLELKRTGECTFIVPEELFDLDYAGHYLRRIKSVSISIPCIAGPYTTISCELRLLKSKYRKTAIVGVSGYKEDPNPWDNPGSGYDTEKFVYFGFVPNSSAIATSTAQNDSGVFELNFRDERYLPFEGLGAISEWRITLPNEYRQFDYENISDAIIHIKYTAKEGGDILKAAATSYLGDVFGAIATSVLSRYFSLKHEYSNDWFAYSKAFPVDDTAKIPMKIDESAFPFYCKGKTIEIQKFHVMLNPRIPLSATYKLYITYPITSGTHTVEFPLEDNINNYYYSSSDILTSPNIITIEGNSMILQVSLKDDLSGDTVNIDSLCNDILIVMDYSIS